MVKEGIKVATNLLRQITKRWSTFEAAAPYRSDYFRNHFLAINALKERKEPYLQAIAEAEEARLTRIYPYAYSPIDPNLKLKPDVIESPLLDKRLYSKNLNEVLDALMDAVFTYITYPKRIQEYSILGDKKRNPHFIAYEKEAKTVWQQWVKAIKDGNTKEAARLSNELLRYTWGK